MEKVQIKNATKDNILLSEAEIADTFYARLKGLLGRQSLNEDTGLIIEPCNSVHMIGMRFPIDVIFADQDKKVCKVIQGMKPMSVSPIIKHARYAIETPAGTIDKSRVEVNDILEWRL